VAESRGGSKTGFLKFNTHHPCPSLSRRGVTEGLGHANFELDMNPITIRDMQPEDVPDVAAIEKLCFSMPWSEHSFYSEVYGKYSITRVAVSNENIVGYVIARLVLDEGHLLDLAVHPEFRKLGIGRMLLDDIVYGLKLNKCTAFFLEVRASNKYALQLYEKMGFKLIGTRKNYYKLPVEDACIMMLDLKIKV
jgi:ribosomal-protein-alanine N-acetyltransferase